ncbi:alkaline phosphatase [Oceanidesulfovibrio indonesiensis]|uniref:Alkaline phosphatase n=1 Tax=Oceanidesulfovibrio indonesiensis TaxID=54767 RepID=A0A7M3MEL9_9BACT|nr:alkaline phosphatase [Oceanidesulfovibrio indonesiensis]
MYTMKRMTARSIALLVAFVLLTAAPALAKSSFYEGKPAKYVFLFIGDGMGLPQKAATEQFAGKQLVLDQFPAQGITTTFAADRFITGSAAATAMAAGVKTNIGMLGMTPDQKKVKNIAQLAKEQGKKVGIISSVSIDHATPAAFYSHVPKRSMYHEIDHALAESGFDFFGGGGLKDPEGKRLLKKDPNAKTLGDAMAKIKDNGYQIVTEKESFMSLKPGAGKILAYNEWLQDSEALPYHMDNRPQDITLPEFTEKAIELLDNDNGFFIMVEGGKIDWACHANDAAAAVMDTIAFDEAVQKAVAFAEKHPGEVLIVVSGDHECGGLAIGFAGTKYDTDFQVLGNQKISYTKFDQDVLDGFKGSFNELKPLITENFGLKFEGDPKADPLVLTDYQKQLLEKAFEQTMKGEKERAESEETFLLYGGYNPLSIKITHILNNKAGLGWTSYSHTGVPVGTSAMGVGADTFNGYYENTDVAKKIMAVMGLEAKVYAMDDDSPAKVAVK